MLFVRLVRVSRRCDCELFLLVYGGLIWAWLAGTSWLRARVEMMMDEAGLRILSLHGRGRRMDGWRCFFKSGRVTESRKNDCCALGGGGDARGQRERLSAWHCRAERANLKLY